MKGKTFTVKDVKRIAILANIPTTPQEEQQIADGFTTTIEVVDTLFSVDVQRTEPTHQVTGLENVFRTDDVDEARMLSQKAALANAPRTHKGFFMVDAVIDQES